MPTRIQGACSTERDGAQEQSVPERYNGPPYPELAAEARRAREALKAIKARALEHLVAGDVQGTAVEKVLREIFEQADRGLARPQEQRHG
jgi:hypothetical protein